MPLTTPYGVTITVEAAFSASTGSYGAWGVGLWNSATWGPEELWVDISKDVRSIKTTRRFSRDLQAWQTGEAELVLRNFRADYSPWNLSGPYVSAGVTQLRPWRALRITASWSGVTYPIYRGYAMDYQEFYEQASPGGGGAYVTIPCVDEWAALAGFDGLEQAAVGAGETTGRRIHRLLDAAGHTGTRDIDVGQITVQATTLASNAADELVLTGDSEAGAVYVGADGTVRFDDQLALIQKTRSATTQVTYGDGPGEMPYSEVTPTTGGSLIKNIASFARIGGTTQTVADQTSRALYRDKRTTRTDLICETDAQVATIAALWTSRFSQPEQRAESILLRPLHAPTRMWPEVLGRQIRDRVTINRRPPPGGITVSADCHVAGISHTISEDNWLTSIEFWSAKPWSNFTTSLWDAGRWDTALWFF